MPWKNISFSGKIESRFLFRTAISKSILPFALYKPDLVVLPIIIENKETGKEIILKESSELRTEGYLDAAKWFKHCEDVWAIHRTEKSEKMTSNDRLNFQRGLSDQMLDVKYLVLYNSSAKDANATVVTRKDLDLPFIIESKTYVHYTSQKAEAYFLTAILNSNIANERIKDFQTKGLFGARDVHKRILDIYYPLFDVNEPIHTQLVELSERAHIKTAEYIRHHPPQQELTAIHLGKLRNAIKKHLAKELAEIDKSVKKIIR
jgi:hypothetical protein